MAEYIERKAVAEPFDCETVKVNGEVYLRHRDVAEFLKSIPAADVAPVVRCADCRHGEMYCDNDDRWIKCNKHPGGLVMDRSFFCADGERKGDD